MREWDYGKNLENADASMTDRFANDAFDVTRSKTKEETDREEGRRGTGEWREQRLQQNKPLNNEFREWIPSVRREARDNKTERDAGGGRRGTKGGQEGGEWVAEGTRRVGTEGGFRTGKSNSKRQ